MTFKKFDIIDENIFDSQTFDDSRYSGVDRLLKIGWWECMVALSTEDEEVGEYYFMLEGNGENKGQEGDAILIEMDGVEFVIVDFFGEYAIVINEKSKKQAEELLTD